MTEINETIARLRELLAKVTPGPYDSGHNLNLVRAIRGDLAVPLFECRAPYADPDLSAPGARNPDGGWLWKKNSKDARFVAAMAQEHINGEALAEILNALPALLTHIATLEARVKASEAKLSKHREALERIAKGREVLHADGTTTIEDDPNIDPMEIARDVLKDTHDAG